MRQAEVFVEKKSAVLVFPLELEEQVSLETAGATYGFMTHCC